MKALVAAGNEEDYASFYAPEMLQNFTNGSINISNASDAPNNSVYASADTARNPIILKSIQFGVDQ